MNKIKENKEVVIGILAISIILSLLLWVFIPVRKDIEVLYIGWKYTVDVEEFKTVEESGWSVPNGGRIKDSYRKLKDTEEYTDNKGVVHEEKIYATWYVYDIDRWKYKTTLVTTEYDRNPHYDNTYRLASNERYGRRKEIYYIKDINGDKYECDKELWDLMEKNGKIRVTKFRFGNKIIKSDIDAK